MNFQQKIDKILSIKGIKLYKLAEISDLGNTLEKAYDRNGEMNKTTTQKFLHNMGINQDWWENPKGDDIFLEPDQNNEPSMATIEAVYRNLIESNKEYRILPTVILEQYSIIPNKVLDDNRETVNTFRDEYIQKKIEVEKKQGLIEKAHAIIDQLKEENARQEKELNELRAQLFSKGTKE